MKTITTVICVAAIVAVSAGRIIHVPGEYPTIQAGIDAAGSGDVVMVAAGIYPEEILLKAGVIVQGAGEDLSIIDGGDDPGDVVRAIGSAINRDTKLRGFTIRGARNSGGMPGGGGVFCNSGAKPDIGNCRITGNDCGVACWNASEAYVHNCVVIHNTYNGISTGAGATFINNTVHSCRIGFSDNSGYGPVFMNNIVTGCSLYGVYGPGGGTPPQLTYNDVWGNGTNYRQATPGTGSISADPLYEDTLTGDFHLQAGSPCIDTGNPAVQYNDPDGSRNDMGAYGGPEAASNLLRVVNVDPAQNALEVDPGTDVAAGFSLDLDPGSVFGGTFLVRGAFTGVHLGEVEYDSSARVATLDPDVDFLSGEPASVTLTRGIATRNGDSLAGFSWSFTTAVAGGAGLLGTRVDYRSNGGVNAVALADLDRDGNLDVVTTNEDAGNVAVLLGDGGGGLAERVLYPAGTNTHGLCCGDFNSDSVLDVAAAVSGGDSVAVLLGNGDGTLQATLRYSAGDFPEDVRCADIDLDGCLDLVTADAFGDEVSWLRGNGDGTFEPPNGFSTGDEPRSLTIGDFDGDGFPDLAVACSGADQVSVLLGNGDGTFQSATGHNVGADPYSVVSADFDEDGDLDLAVSNLMSGNVSYLAGDGAGGFATRVNYEAGSGPRSATAGDFNADGHSDLLVANEGSDSVAFLFGTGSGGFLAPVFSAAGSEPLHAVSGDLDIDGDLDVVATSGDRDVSVFLNEDQLEVVSNVPAQYATAAPETTGLRSSFSIPVDPATLDSSSFRCFGSQTGIHPGAVGYDSAGMTGWLDPDRGFAPGEEVYGLLTADIESRSGVNLRGFGWQFSVRVPTASSGDFENRQDFASAQGTRGFWAADLDGDGDCDIAVGSANYPNPGQLVVLKNNGDGTFAAPVQHSLGAADPIALFGADMDADGDVDIVSGHNEPGTSHLVVMKNDGSGGFTLFRSYAPAILGQHVSGGDLDADGDIDIVFIDGFGTSNHVKVMLNAGDGSLAGPTSYSAGSFTRGAAVLDTDNDGDNDVLVCNSGNDNLSVFKNDGTGIFPYQASYPTGSGPTAVWGHDLDGDGWVDLVTSGSDGKVTVLLGNGDGTFGPPQGYAAGGNTRYLAGGDLDGDGDLDLVAAHSDAQSAAVLMNDGDGTFGSATVYGLGDYPSGLGLADFDLDLALDFAGGNYNDADVAVWYNTGTVGIVAPARRAVSRTEPATVVRGVLALPAWAAGGDRQPGLFDAGGRQVMDLMPGLTDVTGLAPGIYFIRAGTEDGGRASKVVVAR